MVVVQRQILPMRPVPFIAALATIYAINIDPAMTTHASATYGDNLSPVEAQVSLSSC